MTGLSMRTLFEAHEQTILVAEGIADIRGTRASIMTAGDPLALIFQKLTRRRLRFADAMLAKIAAAEAQAVADAERIAEMEADRAAALPALKDAYEYWLADATDDEEAAEIAEEQLREHIQDYMAAGLHRDLESGKDWREVEQW